MSPDPMRTLIDVNLLVALLDEDHVHHGRAHEWWSANREDGWASCPLTQNGCIRVISQPSYPNQVSFAFAHDFLSQQIAATDHAFWLLAWRHLPARRATVRSPRAETVD